MSGLVDADVKPPPRHPVQVMLVLVQLVYGVYEDPCEARGWED